MDDETYQRLSTSELPLKIGNLMLSLSQDAVAFLDVLLELGAFVLNLLMFRRVNTVVLYEGS